MLHRSRTLLPRLMNIPHRILLNLRLSLTTLSFLRSVDLRIMTHSPPNCIWSLRCQQNKGKNWVYFFLYNIPWQDHNTRVILVKGKKSKHILVYYLQEMNDQMSLLYVQEINLGMTALQQSAFRWHACLIAWKELSAFHNHHQPSHGHSGLRVCSLVPNSRQRALCD